MNFFLSILLLISLASAFDVSYGTGTSDKVQILFDSKWSPFSLEVLNGSIVTTQTNYGFVLETPVDRESSSMVKSYFDVI